MSSEDDIIQQLERSQPVQINAEGQIVAMDQVRQGPDGQPIDNQTGQPTAQLKPARWA